MTVNFLPPGFQKRGEKNPEEIWGKGFSWSVRGAPRERSISEPRSAAKHTTTPPHTETPTKGQLRRPAAGLPTAEVEAMTEGKVTHRQVPTLLEDHLVSPVCACISVCVRRLYLCVHWMHLCKYICMVVWVSVSWVKLDSSWPLALVNDLSDLSPV